MAKKTTKPKVRRAIKRVVPAAAKTATKAPREKTASRRAADESQVAVAENLRGKYVYCVIQSADSLKPPGRSMAMMASQEYTRQPSECLTRRAF